MINLPTTNVRAASIALIGSACFSPLATAAKWFEEMQIGPVWSNSFSDTYQNEERVGATKGILIDLGENRRVLFDTETLRYVTGYEGGITWGGTPWTGSHGQLVMLDNENGLAFTTAEGPGWADAKGAFNDTRKKVSYALYSRKRKRSEAEGAFGDLGHGSFKGFYRHGSDIVLDYEVLGTRILDHPRFHNGAITRDLEIAPHRELLKTRIADDGNAKFAVSEGGELLSTKNGLFLLIPASDTVVNIALSTGGKAADLMKLDSLLTGGKGLWPETVETKAEVATKKGAWMVDSITLPTENPWKANLRFGGFDFIDDDRAALSSWNGDVWVVSGLKAMTTLTWKRFASGLFEPLGLKVVGGVIHVNGRDQITKLHDLNQDGEADHYECFNRDVTVSPNFHEFAFDLQTDKDGYFYFSKAAPVRPGGRGFDLILGNHGTVVRVSPDGSSSEVIATGLRAPGGVGVGPNGEISTGENEGTWQPCCKINFITKDQRPAFFGTEPSRQFLKDAPYTEPLCYLPMDVDNSGGSQVWVPDGSKWGLNGGEMVHLSYGKSSLYRVLPETVNGTLQGGIVRLPFRLRSSAMRARFSDDDSLFVLGFRGWQTNAATECAFQRVRRGSEVVGLPSKLETTKTGLRLTFELPLDEELAADPTSFSAQRWDYVRGPQYGSGEFSVDHPDAGARELALKKESKNHRKRDSVKVIESRLLDDGKTVEIDLEGHKPSMQLKLSYDLETEDGDILEGTLHSTIREIPN